MMQRTLEERALGKVLLQQSGLEESLLNLRLRIDSENRSWSQKIRTHGDFAYKAKSIEADDLYNAASARI